MNEQVIIRLRQFVQSRSSEVKERSALLDRIQLSSARAIGCGLATKANCENVCETPMARGGLIRGVPVASISRSDEWRDLVDELRILRREVRNTRAMISGELEPDDFEPGLQDA